MLKPRRLLLWALIAGTAFLFQYSSCTYAALAQTSSAPDVEERQRGIELYRQKNFVEATKLLKKAVQKNKLDEHSWYYLGLSLASQSKELKNATKAFETAIKLKPNFAAAHAGLGYVLLRRNKFSEALHAAQSALKLEPEHANAHYVVGVIRLNDEAYEDALAAANEVIRLTPKLAAAYLLKSEALWGMYKGPMEYWPCGSRRLTRSGPTPIPVPPPSLEQREEMRRKRKQEQALLIQSAESLATYLSLNPGDPSGDRWREQLATLKTFGNVEKSAAEAIKSGAEVTTKARVLAKPAPHYTDEARAAGVRGFVVLRAVFGSDGKVREIVVIKGLPGGLTWQAVDAARQIKFTPALLDGKPVSMFVQLEYCFNLY